MDNRFIRGSFFRLLVFLVLPLLSKGSTKEAFGPESLKFYKARFPEAPFVYLQKEEHTRMDIKDGVLSLKQHHKEQFMILKSGFNGIRRKRISTSFFVEVKDIKASIHRLIKGSYSREPIRDVVLKSEEDDEGIFYSDNKSYYVSFAVANEGDVITIEYDEVYSDPRLFGSLFVSDYAPSVHEIFTLSYPRGQVKYRYRIHNNQNLPVFNSKDSTRTQVTETWKFDSVPALKDEDYDPSYRHKATYFLLAVESYLSKDKTVPVAGSVEKLYAWYSELLRRADTQLNPAIKLLADSLCGNDTSKIGQLQKLFYWVQDKIAYLAYEDGLGGFVPRDAHLVCDRKFGDCKDMANLLVQLGRSRGLPVYPAWIGTRDIPHQVKDFPGPFCFNHLIAVYVNGKDTLFLDATGKYYPFGIPTPMIQGKEALVGLSAAECRIFTVPWLPTTFSGAHDSVDLKLRPDLDISGEGFLTLHGFEKARLFSILTNKSYDERMDFLKSALEKGNNKFRLDTFSITSDEHDGKMVIAYKFLIKDYVIRDNGKIFLRLNFLGDFFDRLELDNRKYSIYYNYRSHSKLTVNLQCGKGFKADHLPSGSQFSSSCASFKYTYDAVPGRVIFRNQITMDKGLIGSGELGALNDVVTAYRKNKSEIISLTTLNP